MCRASQDEELCPIASPMMRRRRANLHVTGFEDIQYNLAQKVLHLSRFVLLLFPNAHVPHVGFLCARRAHVEREQYS